VRNREIRLEAEAEGLWLHVGLCSVVYLSFSEAQELQHRVRAFLDASPIPNEPVPTEGLEVVRYEPVEDVPDCLPAITPPLSPTEQSEAEMASERG
jgi:hypothetical protein